MNVCTLSVLVLMLFVGLVHGATAAEEHDFHPAWRETIRPAVQRLGLGEAVENGVGTEANERAAKKAKPRTIGACGAPCRTPDARLPTSVPFSGTPWRFSLDGYAKFDALHDFDGTGDEYQFTTATIPVKGAPGYEPGSYTTLHARQTRLSLEARNVSPDYPVNRVFAEIDFFGDTPTSPRLRQAYMQWGNLVAGRAWSTLTERRALPFLLDFAYGHALYGQRASLLRWQKKRSDHFGWAAAIEAWNDSLIENVSNQAGVARSDFPLVAVRGTYQSSAGLIMLGASLAQLRWDGTEGTPDAVALQRAAVFASRIYLDSASQSYIGLSGSYGDGSAGNIIALYKGDVPDAVLKPNGHLDTLPAWDQNIAFHWVWSDALSSNFSYARAGIEPSPLVPPTVMKSDWVAHVNLIWRRAKPFLIGGEYMVGERKNVNGGTGTAHRIQFSTVYYF